MDIFLSIASNGALLLSLTFLYSLTIPYIKHIPRWQSSILTGFLFGAFTLLNMLQPIRFGEGVIVDPRNVILMVAAALGGFRAGFIAFSIAGIYRLYLGGMGTNVGLASMLTAVLIGFAYERYRQRQAAPQKEKAAIRFDRYTVLMGILVGLESLLWTLLLPDGYGWTLLPNISLPVMVVYAAVTYIMVWLIASAYQRIALSAALQESEGRLEAIFVQSLQFLCIMEADGAVSKLNLSLLNAAKLPESAILGKKFWEVPWPFLNEKCLANIQKAVETVALGGIKRLSLDADKDGGAIVLDIAFQHIAETGQILMEAYDISAQVQDEKRRLELQFERERNDILQQLIGDASHHLRTPLSVLSSSIYLLRKQIEQQDPQPELKQKMEGQIRKLDSARQELADIVEDLLSMMHLDSAAAFRFERLELVLYVSQIIDNYREIAEEKQIRLDFDKTEMPLLVSIVPSSFRRVIENLLENALRYTPAGGAVMLRICPNAGMAEISVRDTGIGIPQEDLARIFDRFYRAKNASLQSQKGTGLGLAIVKKTLELHKGQIAIESELGKGTLVTAYIPLLTTNVLAAS